MMMCPCLMNKKRDENDNNIIIDWRERDRQSFQPFFKINIPYKVGSQKVSKKGTFKWVWGAVFWRVRT